MSTVNIPFTNYESKRTLGIFLQKKKQVKTRSITYSKSRYTYIPWYLGESSQMQQVLVCDLVERTQRKIKQKPIR